MEKTYKKHAQATDEAENLKSQNQKTKTTTGVVGFENRQRCETKFKNSPKEEVVYSYSTITFILDGREQTVEFQKLP